MNVLELVGCRSQPLGSYLKALGVLRLLGEQRDSSGMGHWNGDTFVLTSALTREELVAFFVDEYRPTPFVAPWNGGSGFGPKDQQAGIEAIESSDSPRLSNYREAIGIGRMLRARADRDHWEKVSLVEACRGALPDEAVAWIDAAVVMSGDGLSFPPILGSGGNDGRLEFSNNFMQRLAEVLCLIDGKRTPTRADSSAWVEDALFADCPAPGLGDRPIGQFDPGRAGGVNSAPLGAAKSLVNPWDFVLLLEGALVFASAAARRMGGQRRGTASMPFTVRSSPVGYGSAADEESARGELWAPLWRRPASAGEVARLMGEGRSDWRRRQARTGLDFARAAASLGVDRGVDAFVRHVFVQRHGKNMLAVPVGRVRARARPEVPVVSQVDPWVERLRRGANPPAAVRSALRRIDSALYELALRGGTARMQEVLAGVADAEDAVSRAGTFRDDAGIRPISGLSAHEWLPRLDDGSPEFRVAAALASQRDHGRVGDLRTLLTPVELEGGSRPRWTAHPAWVSGFRRRPLADVLAEALVCRTRQAAEAASGGDGAGVRVAYRLRVPAPVEAVDSFVRGDLDEGRLERLLGGLLLLEWYGKKDVAHWLDGGTTVVMPEPAWALLAPFFHGREVAVNPGRPIELLAHLSWAPQLASERLAPVVESALLRLRMARLAPGVVDVEALSANAPPASRIGAALLCPLTTRAVSELLTRVVHPTAD